jgi:glucosamine 6-phosphate synthetase-like amidotransferase/phosphosugar isomerase protein
MASRTESSIEGRKAEGGSFTEKFTVREGTVMCGIAGVRRYADNPITEAELKTLLCSLEYRGNHATGVALMTPDGIQIHKEAVPAWSFIASKDTKEFFEAWLPDASMALLHTRFATVGDPGDNDNNHPFFAGQTAIVHNGSISNHDYLFRDLKLDRTAETDSDIIRAILDEKGISEEGVTVLNRMAGSAAVAAFSEAEPNKLLLARSGSPLVYGLADNGDKLWWASDATAIQRAVRPWVRINGLWARKNRSDVAYFTMPDNTAYVLNGNELQFRQEFKVCINYTSPPYNANRNYVAQSYAHKQRSFKTERERKERLKREERKDSTSAITIAQSKFTHKVAPCPYCKVACYIARADSFSTYTCHSCKKSLISIPTTAVSLCKDPSKI